VIIGQLALEIVALWLALRSRARLLAVVLVYALVDELVVAGLQGLVLAGASRPFTGWARVAYHLETALVLGWPAALACAAGLECRMPAVRIPPVPGTLTRVPSLSVPDADAYKNGVFRNPASFFSVLVWALAVVVLAIAFPLPRGWTAPTLHALSGLFVAVAVVALGGGFRRRRLGSFEPWALASLVAVELVVATCGAWGNNVFRDWETLARIPHCAGLLVAIGFLAYETRR